MAMTISKATCHQAIRVTALALLMTLASGFSAQAHHVMGGRTPATFMEGLLSGLGHPVVGIDHLAFIVAMGVAVGAAGMSLLMPAVFVVASAIGVALHVRGVVVPVAELVVAASVLLVGAMLASGRAMRASIWIALFAVAGLFHGYAFGESIYGAERAPLLAYLAGLVLVQAALATGIAIVTRRLGAGAVPARLAGATIAGIGIAILAGQLLPA